MVIGVTKRRISSMLNVPTALGVRKREDSLKQNSADPKNFVTVPSAKEHADALGVSRPTVARWEKDRKEIMADPELAEKATTLEAWEYVNDHNGEDGRRMLSKADLQDFYYAWSESVGVRDKGNSSFDPFPPDIQGLLPTHTLNCIS